MISFTDYMRMREGLLAAEPTGNGLSRINTTPLTQVQRKKLVPVPSRPKKPFAPIARSVATIVPPHLVPTISPS